MNRDIAKQLCKTSPAVREYFGLCDVEFIEFYADGGDVGCLPDLPKIFHPDPDFMACRPWRIIDVDISHCNGSLLALLSVVLKHYKYSLREFRLKSRRFADARKMFMGMAGLEFAKLDADIAFIANCKESTVSWAVGVTVDERNFNPEYYEKWRRIHADWRELVKVGFKFDAGVLDD